MTAAADELWDTAEFREERYLAIDLVRPLPPDSTRLPVYRHWIRTGAWWDLVDAVATGLVGPLLPACPDVVRSEVRSWVRDRDRWLRRAAVVCQVRVTERTDIALLTEVIEANLDDTDFFLRKAIGWALRAHARADPEWVRSFVIAHPGLSPLSRREALKHTGPVGAEV